MLGVVGQTRFVMGCITQTEDGRFSIEDLSASLRLDLSDAVVAAGFMTGTESAPHPATKAHIVFEASYPEKLRDTDTYSSSMAWSYSLGAQAAALVFAAVVSCPA